MRVLLLAPLLAGALVIAACGSSNSSTSSTSSSSTPAASAPAAGQKLNLKADPAGGLTFEPTKLTAKAGAVTLVMDNPSTSGIQHGVAVEGKGVDKDGQIVAPGSTSTVTVTLKPGTYEYYCPIPAHKAAGMKGTLVVS
jgi:plastocyanin